MASMICAVHVSRGAPSCHALAGAARSQPTLHRSGEVLLPALSRNTDAAFLVSTLHFPPEQEGYLAYAVIIPTLIFIGHSGRALKDPWGFPIDPGGLCPSWYVSGLIRIRCRTATGG